MIRKLALAALAATAVFQVAVFIQYGTLWGGALASYRELPLVFAFLLATFGSGCTRPLPASSESAA